MDKMFSVTNDEKTEIQTLLERRNSLVEIRDILKNKELLAKHEQDLVENKQNINVWWNTIFEKYNVVSRKQNCYIINFEDNGIYLK